MAGISSESYYQMEFQQADPASGAERNHFIDEWNVTGQGGIRQLVK